MQCTVNCRKIFSTFVCADFHQRYAKNLIVDTRLRAICLFVHLDLQFHFESEHYGASSLL